MRLLTPALLLLVAVPVVAQDSDHSTTPAVANAQPERLGTVSFSVSCTPASQVAFDRGVALLHDFWYSEAKIQFSKIVTSDPKCAMAHWGIAMSMFHQIWGRPAPDVVTAGWAEMKRAEALHAGTQREKQYIAALADFYRPGKEEYPARIAAYSAAMRELYADNPADVDAGAFYALSLLAATRPDDTSLEQNRKAMAVLKPLFASDPDNPGVDHYIIHACDNPAMSAEGLAAADHYLTVAQSGPHAYHMPGHIYARLGLWQKDIVSQKGSIAASQAAEAHGEGGLMDEPHSYDFLQYAELQSGNDAAARAAMEGDAKVLDAISTMPDMSAGHRAGMVPYYRVKLPAFYALETHAWKAAANLEPPAGSPPEVALEVYWVRGIAHGRLKDAKAAEVDLAKFDDMVAELKRGRNAYMVEGPGEELTRAEIVGWIRYADGKKTEALQSMRTAADLQDKVGQDEVDVPAREMLGDLLMEYGQPQEALAEYETSLKLSPNRLNGLYDAGRAAEDAGNQQKAKFYYAALLKNTNGGNDSTRPELARAKRFMATNVAEK